MNLKTFGRGMGMASLVLSLTAGADRASALDVLTFDTGNPERNSSVGALGFSITSVGAGALGGIDFGAYDVIYIAQSYEELLTSSLLGALGSRGADLADFVANGGGLVFGSPAVGGLTGSGIAPTGSHPITDGVDLSTLGLSTQISLPGIDNLAGNVSGAPVIQSALLGQGRVVEWNPGAGPGLVTDESLTLVSNSIAWAGNAAPAAVPEPGTYALFGLGLAGFTLLRRRARKKA